MSRKTLRGLALAAVVALGLTACGTTETPAADAPATDNALTIFATTGYLGDAAQVLAPEAKVTVMVQPGGDPHTYQPTTQDIEAMQSADLVLWNGLHLEALMIDQLREQGDRQLEVGANVPHELLLDWPEEDDQGNPLHDPHIWNSPEIWKGVVDQIATRLGEIDADNAATYTDNAKAYNAKIDEIDSMAKEKFAQLKDENRVLVTGHDAFNYLGARYNLKVYATDFVTSEAEMSPAQLEELATTIANAKVPAIFIDNLKNPQAVESLQEAVKAKGWEVAIADEELYADSLGEAAPVDTYLGVFEHNVLAVTKGLGVK
ncbi:metal ABC transporter substrate-binding protein [Schaalia canis]|uniref:Zinc ABC transporter substrate-binding protein n=1 Tax=Schaalia canis TaxID=100469 RepID=A0A3P1SBQ5_9ACTO|nr:metal ABC transporter substrate-binding protein [Schaalia canis]RRC94703.1 zinc ABC transporter substrate-binding protein [Schaalia canis]